MKPVRDKAYPNELKITGGIRKFPVRDGRQKWPVSNGLKNLLAKKRSLAKGGSILLLFSTLFLIGCEEVSKIDTTNDTGKQVMSLDYRDFDQAASKMIQSLISSGKLAKKDGSRYVVSTGQVTNDTMQRIDTDLLTAKIEQDLTNSGQVVMTSAVGGKESNRDETVYNMRETRDSSKGEEFKQETLPQKGQIISPELSLSGKIYQRNLRYDNDKQQVEYYFQLKMTDIKTGLRFWQEEVLIGKRGSNTSVAW